jgi:predicted glycoside hydrolase/deacetylase ChbG (UPF0249 family)
MNPRANLNTNQLKKLRDLFIGMILNLTCNIEETEMIKYMVTEHKILKVLVRILQDARNDWPTHGAA